MQNADVPDVAAEFLARLPLLGVCLVMQWDELLQGRLPQLLASSEDDAFKFPRRSENSAILELVQERVAQALMGRTIGGLALELSGFDSSTKGGCDRPPLSYAAAIGRVAYVRGLLAHAASEGGGEVSVAALVGHQSEDGASAIEIARACGHSAVVQALAEVQQGGAVSDRLLNHDMGVLGPELYGPRISGDVGEWRAANPSARAANVSGRVDLRPSDFAHFQGLEALNMAGCFQGGLEDSVFEHLQGIRYLNISCCWQLTDAAFAHLAGIHTLDMSLCTQRAITDAAFVHLSGIHTLVLRGCNGSQITEHAFRPLSGVRTLNMAGCTFPWLNDAEAFPYIAGVKEIDVSHRKPLSAEAFACLQGVERLVALSQLGE